MNTYNLEKNDENHKCKEIIDELLKLCTEKLTYEEDQNIDEIFNIIKKIFEQIIFICEHVNDKTQEDDFYEANNNKYQSIMSIINEINSNSENISINDFIKKLLENGCISL